ncbi:hypothetical protein SHKM778_21010 [Streptomyces sp. KM77-8]|uniref:Uncharacterized protein n=1 Tax=Streptomyces haneummycinicus TaxID=3074435 RepID=A0AAT9HE77_9ACTN
MRTSPAHAVPHPDRETETLEEFDAIVPPGARPPDSVSSPGFAWFRRTKADADIFGSMLRAVHDGSMSDALDELRRGARWFYGHEPPNAFASRGEPTPMTLVDRAHWTERLPARPLPTSLARERSMGARIALVDRIKEAPGGLETSDWLIRRQSPGSQ